MAISSARIAAIHAIVDEIEDEAERVSQVANLATEEELQYLARYYNWDDGFAIPTTIANHRLCDLSVALTLFWLAEGIVWYTKEIKVDSYNREWGTFCEMVGRRILDGYYRKNVGSKFSAGLNQSQRHKYSRLGVPKVLYEDTMDGNR